MARVRNNETFDGGPGALTPGPLFYSFGILSLLL